MPLGVLSFHRNPLWWLSVLTVYLQVHTQALAAASLLCFMSEEAHLQKKNLKSLGFYSYRQYGCNCTWPPLMLALHDPQLPRMSCFEIPNTQILDKPSSSLLSLQTEHEVTIFYLYICICRAIYLLICNFIAKELLTWTLWSPFSITDIAEGVVRSDRHVVSLVLKHFYLDKDFPSMPFIIFQKC